MATTRALLLAAALWWLPLHSGSALAQQGAGAAITIEPLWSVEEFVSGREALELR